MSRRAIVVLSGGGARAAAHVGALRALVEHGLTPSHYVGTSMGAVIGAMAAAGLDAAEQLARVSEAGRRSLAVPAPLAAFRGLALPALLRPEPLRETIRALVPARRFDQLATPLTVTAVDLDDGTLVRFGARGEDVPLADALYASCALPVFYPPALIDGRRYADGGLRAPLPLESAAGLDAELVVAVDIGPGFDDSPAAPPRAEPPFPRMVRAHAEATGILMATVTAAQLAQWRGDSTRVPLLYIRPPVERDATFRGDRAAVYAEEGYRAACEAIAGLTGFR